MANFPHGNIGFGGTVPNPPRTRSPSYLIHTPAFISFKVTNLPTIYRFSMERGEIREKSIRKQIKKATGIKGKTLLMRDNGGLIIRIDNDLMLQYHIGQMEARQRREGATSQMELLIGDKHGSILQFHTQGWMQV